VRLALLSDLHGNTDRYLVSGQRPYPTLSDVAADTTLISRLVEVARSFAWTQGALMQAFDAYSCASCLTPQRPAAAPLRYLRHRLKLRLQR
jgi:hypothetical protein